MKTAMKELRDKLQIVIGETEEDFSDGTTNQYNMGYKEAMVNVVKDIDAQMLTKEKQHIIDARMDGISKALSMEIDKVGTSSSENYYNQSFK